MSYDEIQLSSVNFPYHSIFPLDFWFHPFFHPISLLTSLFHHLYRWDFRFFSLIDRLVRGSFLSYWPYHNLSLPICSLNTYFLLLDLFEPIHTFLPVYQPQNNDWVRFTLHCLNEAYLLRIFNPWDDWLRIGVYFFVFRVMSCLIWWFKAVLSANRSICLARSPKQPVYHFIFGAVRCCWGPYLPCARGQ